MATIATVAVHKNISFLDALPVLTSGLTKKKAESSEMRTDRPIVDVRSLIESLSVSRANGAEGAGWLVRSSTELNLLVAKPSIASPELKQAIKLLTNLPEWYFSYLADNELKDDLLVVVLHLSVELWELTHLDQIVLNGPGFAGEAPPHWSIQSHCCAARSLPAATRPSRLHVAVLCYTSLITVL